MKQTLPVFLLFGLFGWVSDACAQVTSAVVRANFGVDADLNSNYLVNVVITGNDDWFNNSATNTIGQGIIDTTGASSIISQYASNPSSRQLTFTKGMAFAPFGIVNHRMVLDADFVRDYHGSDSTMFASGASKNGMSPADWSCPVAQSVPDKNEILDMMVHVRRAGPDYTDSLWMFGGVSIENTTGDRYFDFEMYQTDLTYNRSSLSFSGYGPDAGHTSWKFDASGNVISPGDIIFSADYGSSTLSYIEARIWVDKASLSIVPQAFNWSGTFDGAGSGSQYGYAGITPKTAGTFYVGTESAISQWAGAFELIRGDNSIVTSYTPGQYMEFGVNLTKLGLDPASIAGDPCGFPFKKLLVKTRSSTSFTAALKDFVAPFSMFQVSPAQVDADTTALCGLVGSSTIKVTNPVSTSTYTWSTSDGHIATYYSDTAILVDQPGTYIVRQQLQSACSMYAADTIVITSSPYCFVLSDILTDFTGKVIDNKASLNWSVSNNGMLDRFEVEESSDGSNFSRIATIGVNSGNKEEDNYKGTYNITSKGSFVYYRLKIYGKEGQFAYSKTIMLTHELENSVIVAPNPVINDLNINISSVNKQNASVEIHDLSGRLIKSVTTSVDRGVNKIKIANLSGLSTGVYSVKVTLNNNVVFNKMILKDQ